MNPEIVSFQYATNMCLLLENVGGSEQHRAVIANVQSDDLWPSRMHRSGEMNCGVSLQHVEWLQSNRPCDLQFTSFYISYSVKVLRFFVQSFC